MPLPDLERLFANDTIHALFWTLLHSLWQGILIAIAAGLILITTRKSRAALRYNLLSGIFLLFIITNLFTFYYELNIAPEHNGTGILKAISFGANYNKLLNIDVTNDHPRDIAGQIISFFRSNEKIIMLAWFFTIAFKCIQLLSGLRSVYILKRRRVSEAGEYWSNRLKELAIKIRLEKRVVLLRSAIAKMPMVAGHFKPVILFPASILTALPREEIEAILLHELAHIRRKDFLVNILQRLTEIIFFFNPAALWISSLIRVERENCCDDIAIGEMKNKKKFIHALVSFQEYNIASSKYAASFPGKKNHLVNRVKRIITNNNKTLDNMEKISLASGIIITGLMMFAFSEDKQPSLTQEATVAQLAKMDVVDQMDTVPPMEKNNESHSSINTSMDGKQYRIIEMNGKITELYIDNVRIPDDQIQQYKPTIDKIREQMKIDAKKQAEEMKRQQKEMMVQTELMKQNESMMKEQMEKQAGQMKLHEKELAMQSELMKQKELMIKEQMEKQGDQMKLHEKELAMQSEVMKQKELMMKEQMEKQGDQMKLHEKEFKVESEMMKQKESMMKEQMERQGDQMKLHEKEFKVQSEMMKAKQQILKQEMEEQSLQMKMQKEQMQKTMEELKKKIMDSTNQSKPTEPKGVIKPVGSTSIAKQVVQNIKKEDFVKAAIPLSLAKTPLGNKAEKINDLK